MATKPVSRAQAAKIARRSDTVGAYAGKGWVQAVAFVMLLGFTIMAVLAMRTYALSMPLPDKIVGNDGKTIATQEQILHGQELFQGRVCSSTDPSSTTVPTSTRLHCRIPAPDHRCCRQGVP